MKKVGEVLRNNRKGISPFQFPEGFPLAVSLVASMRQG